MNNLTWKRKNKKILNRRIEGTKFVFDLKPISHSPMVEGLIWIWKPTMPISNIEIICHA